MATKSSDAVLRIRAKNLARKDMQGVVADLDAIEDSQRQTATQAKLAARAFKELTDESRALAAITGELAKRKKIVERIAGTPAEIEAAKRRLVELRRELDDLTKLRALKPDLGGLTQAIKTVERDIGKVTRGIDRQEAGFRKAVDEAKNLGIQTDDIEASLKSINSQIDRTAALTREAERAAQGYEGAVREQRAALEAQEQAQRDITEEAQRRNLIETSAARRRREEAAQRAAELREQARIREDLTRRFSGPQYAPAVTPRLGGATQPLGGSEAERQALFRERLVNVMRRQKDGGDRLLRTEHALGKAARTTGDAIERQSRAVQRARKEQGLFNDVGRKSLSVYQRLRGQLLFMASAYLGFYEAIRLVRSSFEIEQQRIAIGIQLNVANEDDPRAAAADFAYLREEADRLGQVFEDVAKGYANYKIAARAVGASNATVRESFSQGLEIVTALRLSTEQAGLVFRAFTQILGKNRVQAEELRNQLGDALPGAVSEFAQSLVDNGIIENITQLDEYFKKGTGGIEDFFNFLTHYAEKTEKSVDEASKTTLANVRRMTNAFRDFQQKFMAGGAGVAISDVVDEITRKLKGREGEELARGLATAFVAVGKAILFALEHFDKLVILLKVFLGFTMAKALYSMAAGMLLFGANTVRAARDILSWTAKVNRAQIAGKGLSVAMRGVLMLTGPLGIGIAALAGVFAALIRNVEMSKARMEDFGNTVDDVMRATTTAELATSVADVNVKLRESISRTNKLRETFRRATEGSGVDKIRAAVELMGEGLNSHGDYQERINQELAIQAGYSSTLETAQRKRTRLAKEEADALAAANAEQDNFTRPPPEETDGSGEAAENKRLNAARAIQKELLQLDQEILDARINGEATSVEQINHVYALRMEQIEAMIAEKALEIDKLAQNAASAGTLEVHKEELALLREKLRALQTALNMQQLERSNVEQLALLQKDIDDEIAKRDARIEAINNLVESHQISEVEGIRRVAEERQRSATVSIQAVQRLIDFIASIEDEKLRKKLGLDRIAEDAEFLLVKLKQTETVMDLVTRNIAGQLAGGIGGAISTLAQGIAGLLQGVNSISDAFKNAGRSFLNFLADFLAGIGEAIMQAILLEAILRAFGKGTGGSWADIAISALTGHTGGVVGTQGVGSGNQRRMVSPLVFANAEKFHGGGLPGLKSNEVPIIAKKNEEILAENDPRNVLNGGLLGGGGGAPRVDLAIHNSIDAESVLAAAAATTGGRKVIFNAIKADVATYRRLFGVNR